MANKIYPKFKKATMTGGANTNLLTGNVKAALVNTTSYTYNDAHEFLSDVAGAAIIASTGAAGSKSVTDLAAFLSGTVVASSVTGAEIDAVILYIDTGSGSTSRLVAYYDTGVTGLPVTPAGASYNVIPDATGWFVE
jgi:hypothetical protein